MMTMIMVPLNFMLLWSISSMNPIKVSIAVLSTSSILFFYMGLNTGTTWIPILMLMLFMGGIIMMFMILSSILPNEKSMKTKTITFLFFTMMFITLMTCNMNFTMESLSANSKAFLMGTKNFIFMVDLILFYFLASMSLINSEQSPMRSIYCYHSLIL